MDKPEVRKTRYLSLAMVVKQYLPSRSTRWVKESARNGKFGAVVRDSGGWLIPEAGVLDYLARNTVIATAEPRPEQRENLRQYRDRKAD